MITSFNQSEIVVIHGVYYTVTGMIEYEQGRWRWKEYQLRQSGGRTVWLSVEVEDNEAEYILYTPVAKFSEMGSYSIEYNGNTYKSYESGIAKVVNYWGKVDVDRNEQVRFEDFFNSETNSYLSIESWDGEREYTYGKELQELEIQISYNSSPNNTYSDNSDSNLQQVRRIKPVLGKILATAGIATFAVLIIMFFINATSKGIDDYLKENSSKYTYVTSITNNGNGKKARVYSTSMSVDSTVNDIINNIPKRIKSVVKGEDESGNAAEDGGTGLMGANEYAYVYTSETNETYVQVSSDEYMDGGERTAYHAHYHGMYYYGGFYRRHVDTVYSSSLSSRQSSVSSRKSSGGGTSVGK